MKRFFAILLICAVLSGYVQVGRAAAASENQVNSRMSTDQVGNQITLDQQADPLYQSKLLAPIQEWKSRVAERTGFTWSLDYNALLMIVNDSPGEDYGSSGVVRFFGYWDLVNRGGPGKGNLNWKIENRHRFSDIPPSALGFESGYVGLFEPVFSNQQNRLTNLYWKQYFAKDTGAAVVGFLDVTDFVDVYLLASPWTGFNNFVFSTGSAAIDLPNDATLGLAAGGMVTDRVYLQAGITDANSDPTDPFQGFENISEYSDFFKWVEIGFTPGQENMYFDNVHVTFWHIDERANGTPDGWGVSASWQQWIGEKWLPFIRGGYTKDSGSLLERSLTVGIGYQPVPQRGVIGLGLNWGKPNQASFEGADDQYTVELYWRYQLTKELAVTPSINFIKDPALNSEQDSLWAYGLRLRFAL